MLTENEVPMEPSPKEPSARFQARTTNTVVTAVMNALRERMGIRAEAIMHESLFGDKPYEATVNVVKNTAGGIVASGWYSQPSRVKLALLESASLVQSYNAIHRKSGSPAVFLLYPSLHNGLKPKQIKNIEKELDQSTWHLEQQGVRVAAHHTEEALAAEIDEWSSDGT